MSEGRKSEDRTARDIAKEYMDQQLQLMQENGLRTEDVSCDEYESLVEEVASAMKC
jgi:hypothetical protein